jgi:NAD(P)-dependent dehydrogenase (short-subunit alcohol dehydrogenase family)
MSYESHFAGKVALVTGAGSGMGRATSIAFAAAGARVVVADVDEGGGSSTVQAISACSGEAVFVHADVSDASNVQSLVQACVDQFGRLDCAANNAGIAVGTAKLADSEDEDFDRMIRVNLRGIYLCLKHEIRQMQRQGEGTIVNIASVNSFRPQIGQSAYTASKHGVIGLTKSAAIEYAESGIRINAVAPGAINTPMLQKALAEFDMDPAAAAARMSPFARFGEPDEIANAVLWLSSPMSAFTTGHVLAVDGGYLAS